MYFGDGLNENGMRKWFLLDGMMGLKKVMEHKNEDIDGSRQSEH